MMIWRLWFFFILANLGWSVDHLGWNHQEVVTISGNPNSACFRCLCRRHFMDCERSSTAFPSCFCPLNISSWWWKKCLPKPGKSQLVHSKLLQDRAIFWMWSQVPGGNGTWPLTDSWEAPPFLSIAAGEFRAADPDPDGEMKVKLEEIDGEGGKWCRDLGRVTGDHMGSHGITKQKESAPWFIAAARKMMFFRFRVPDLHAASVVYVPWPSPLRKDMTKTRKQQRFSKTNPLAVLSQNRLVCCSVIVSHWQTKSPK